MPGSGSSPAGSALMHSDLLVRFGGTTTTFIVNRGSEASLAVPVLAGATEERLPPAGSDLSIGIEVVPVQSDREIESATFDAYRRILQHHVRDPICRIWNYVPAINRITDGLENYRAFCRGRARAFELGWGTTFTEKLPAASAVGGPADALAIYYAVAPGAATRSVENPTQVPAYCYPSEHGPRPPSFSRATCVTGREFDWVFIAGTAAIKGHHTVAPGELAPQIETTLDNLRLISVACGLGEELGSGWERHFKVYLRHAADLARAQSELERRLLRPADSCVWLHSDICRADLEIEIEATLWRRRHP